MYELPVGKYFEMPNDIGLRLNSGSSRLQSPQPRTERHCLTLTSNNTSLKHGDM